MQAKLRPMEDRDLPMVLEWRNAEDVRQNMYTTHLIGEDEHRAWFLSARGNPKTRLLIAVIDDVPAGVVAFTNYTGPGGLATWAFYSGDRTRRGVGGAMEIAALHYAFDELAVRKLDCEVLAFNEPVIRFHQKHGFQVEGIFREAYVRDGKAHDIHRLAMLSRDWYKSIRPVINARALAAEKPGGNARRSYSHTVTVTRASVEAYAEAADDRNPIHLDDAAATAHGFPSAIAHGMLVGSLFSGFFAREFPGPGTIYLSQTLNFHSPVIVGSSVEVRLNVLTEIGRRLLIDTKVYHGDALCISGEATLLAPKVWRDRNQAS